LVGAYEKEASLGARNKGKKAFELTLLVAIKNLDRQQI
jgi:hypothetical protein